MSNTDFRQIAADAKRLAGENTSVNWEAVAFNIVSIPLTMGLLQIPTDDVSKHAQVAMPDEWLVAVSALPEISRAGLALLAEALEKKGWISLADASAFIETEAVERQKLSQQQSTSSSPRAATQGAALLLARAEKELPGTLQRFTEHAGSFVQAVGGVISFGVEKGIWIGKGLGAVASFMRDRRNKQ